MTGFLPRNRSTDQPVNRWDLNTLAALNALIGLPGLPGIPLKGPPRMSARTVALLVCLTSLLFAIHDPTLGLGGDSSFGLIGLAGLGLVTLRSEAKRPTPRATARPASRQA